MLTLYHYPFSTNSAKVRLCLNEKKLKWESQIVDLKNQANQSSDFLKINPQGLVPALADGNNIITENNIIIEYIDDAYPDIRLMPVNTYEKSIIHQSFIDEQLMLPSIMLLTYAWLIKRNTETTPDDLIEKIKTSYTNHPNIQRKKFFQNIADATDESRLQECHLIINN